MGLCGSNAMDNSLSNQINMRNTQTNYNNQPRARKPLKQHSTVNGVIQDISRDKFYEKLANSGVVEDCELWMVVDATASTYNRHVRNRVLPDLHDTSTSRHNHFEQIMTIIHDGFTQDTDGKIPLKFFGSTEANDNKVSPGVYEAGTYDCKDDIKNLLSMYRTAIEAQTRSGPTVISNIIQQAIEHVKKTGRYLCVIILTDGAFNEVNKHCEWLRMASRYPISFTAIGVGWANFSDMEKLDNISGRHTDNFQFTAANDIFKAESALNMSREAFYRMFMELPKHYEQCQKKLNYKPKY